MFSELPPVSLLVEQGATYILTILWRNEHMCLPVSVTFSDLKCIVLLFGRG